MQCTSCGGPAADGHRSSWVTGRRSQDTRLESGVPSAWVTTSLYYDFAPLDMLVCNACFAGSERLEKRRFLAFAALGAAGLAAFLVGIVAGSGTVPVILGVVGMPASAIGLVGALHYSPVYRLAAVEREQHVQERFVRRILRAEGRDVFWTPEDFDRMQRSQ